MGRGVLAKFSLVTWDVVTKLFAIRWLIKLYIYFVWFSVPVFTSQQTLKKNRVHIWDHTAFVFFCLTYLDKSSCPWTGYNSFRILVFTMWYFCIRLSTSQEVLNPAIYWLETTDSPLTPPETGGPATCVPRSHSTGSKLGISSFSSPNTHFTQIQALWPRMGQSVCIKPSNPKKSLPPCFQDKSSPVL